MRGLVAMKFGFLSVNAIFEVDVNVFDGAIMGVMGS